MVTRLQLHTAGTTVRDIRTGETLTTTNLENAKHQPLLQRANGEYVLVTAADRKFYVFVR